MLDCSKRGMVARVPDTSCGFPPNVFSLCFSGLGRPSCRREFLAADCRAIRRKFSKTELKYSFERMNQKPTKRKAVSYQHVRRKRQRQASLLEAISRDPKNVSARLFAHGYALEVGGNHAAAIRCYEQVVRALETWRSQSPQDNREGVLAEIALRHGAKLVRLRRFELSLAVLNTAVFYAEEAIQYSVTSEVVAVLAAAEGWRGLVERLMRNHPAALESYERATAIWRRVLMFAGDRGVQSKYRRALAASLFGMARTLRLMGQDTEAERCRRESSELVRKSRRI